MTTSSTFIFVFVSVLMLVAFGPEPTTAPFPPDDPRAVFNAFIIPWWQQAPRWLRSHIHVHWTGEPLPPDGRIRRYKPASPLEQQPSHHHYQYQQQQHHHPVRPRPKARTPLGNFLTRLGLRRRSRPISLYRSWNEFLDRLLRRRRRRY